MQYNYLIVAYMVNYNPETEILTLKLNFITSHRFNYKTQTSTIPFYSKIAVKKNHIFSYNAIQ